MDGDALVGLALVAALVAAHAAVSRRLLRVNITGPIVFVGIGLLVGPDGLGLVDLTLGDEATATIAEITLALVLFGDASRIQLRAPG